MLNRANYLNITEKNNIINLVKDKKPLTAEVVVVDPVYVGVSVGVFKAGESTDPSVRNKTNIVLTKNRTSPLSDDGIINKAYQIIRTYFEGAELGQTIDINYLVNAILSIPGVDDIHTQRTDDTTVQVPGLSLLLWNPVYGKTDATAIAANITLPYYKYPYLH